MGIPVLLLGLVILLLLGGTDRSTIAQHLFWGEACPPWSQMPQPSI
jgi:hypothetical protein